MKFVKVAILCACLSAAGFILAARTKAEIQQEIDNIKSGKIKLSGPKKKRRLAELEKELATAQNGKAPTPQPAPTPAPAKPAAPPADRSQLLSEIKRLRVEIKSEMTGQPDEDNIESAVVSAV